MDRERRGNSLLSFHGQCHAEQRVLVVHRERSSLVRRQLPKLQGLPVTKAVIYRNVDKKAWEQITKENQVTKALISVL